MLTPGIIHGQTGLTPCKGAEERGKNAILRLKGQFPSGYEFQNPVLRFSGLESLGYVSSVPDQSGSVRKRLNSFHDSMGLSSRRSLYDP